MKFAHISDIHLGFQKQERLQSIEKRVFEDMIDQCVTANVDFILMPGDIFHVNIPEMRVQKFAFAGFRRLHEAGIPVYVVYGSHDFSPVSNSVIDLLAETGYITKVTHADTDEEGVIQMKFTTDKKTRVKITGLPGLKAGKDEEWYHKINREALEAEPGFKIFLFHGNVSDMRTEHGVDGQHMPLSLFPKGFAYYAGGHMHKYNHQRFPDHPHVVYPGTPFAGYHSDLEDNARGQERGFVMVEFDDIVKEVRFVPINNARYEIIDIDASNAKSDIINNRLEEEAGQIMAEEKVIIIKIHGEMTSGRTSDVDVSGIKENFISEGALAVNVSKTQLKSLEYEITGASGKNKDEVETNVFKENIGQVRFSQEKLLGDKGVDLAKRLLHTLGQSQLDNEKSMEYLPRIKRDALVILGADMNDS